MATATVTYSSNTAITMDLANLASSSTFLGGRESSQIDNTTNKYMDALVSGFVSVGTTPTANTSINIYVWGADTSLATTAIDTLDGTDSAETLSNAGVLGALRFGAVVSVPVTTSDFAYPVLPFSVASLFGGVMPKFWGLYVSHNTGVNLRNTAVNTNAFEFVGIKYDIIA
jgi:hypothetical protein